MFQSVTLVGNLGRDPDYRYTPSGVAVCNFNVATSRSWTGKDGQRQERTLWIRVTAWQNLADLCNKYLSKGKKVLVVGELEEPQTWTDQGGNVRANLCVRADKVRFLSPRQEEEDSAPAATNSAQPAQQEEIPF